MKKYSENSNERLVLARKWARVVIDATFDTGDKIPLMTGVTKGTSPQPYGFKTSGALGRRMEIVRNYFPERFQCNSDIMRAGVENVLCMMEAEMEMDKKTKTRNDRFLNGECYDILNEEDPLLSTMNTVDDITRKIRDWNLAFEGGLLTAKEFNDLVEAKIKKFPLQESVRNVLRERKKRILNDEKLADINFMNRPGGSRKASEGTT